MNRKIKKSKNIVLKSTDIEIDDSLVFEYFFVLLLWMDEQQWLEIVRSYEENDNDNDNDNSISFTFGT